MTPRPRKPFTCKRYTDSNVIVQRGDRKPWQLNTRDRRDNGTHASFAHYISAGGLRQLRRTQADDLAARSAVRFFAILGVLTCLWILFHFLPCA